MKGGEENLIICDKPKPYLETFLLLSPRTDPSLLQFCFNFDSLFVIKRYTRKKKSKCVVCPEQQSDGGKELVSQLLRSPQNASDLLLTLFCTPYYFHHLQSVKFERLHHSSESQKSLYLAVLTLGS